MTDINGISTPVTKRGQATFDEICRAAETLFHTKSYHLTTIADIAEAAKVAVGTFYIYFEDKYSLYKHLLLRYSHEIRSTIAIAVKDAKTRREQERLGLLSFILYVRDHPQAYTIIWQSLQVDKNLFVDYYQNFARHYAKGLAEAHGKGELNGEDFKTLAYALMGISNFVGLQVIMFEHEPMDEAAIERIAAAVMRMLDEGLFK